MAKKIQIGDVITVGELAKKLDIPPTQLIGELMKNGVMATVNEKIDFDTAQIVAGEIIEEVIVEKEASKKPQALTREKKKLSANAESRPPVVAVMGHVDHGKTSLLDAIRQAAVADGEAGGITQHISAYQIAKKGRKITFLDTPGHEAFAALREHGAQLTDVAVVVIAADDGIKPQTKEALRFAERAGVKVIIALSKVDKPEADVNRVKQQLAENKLMPEEWGGETVIVEVSSKTRAGIDALLDMVLLVADLEELRAENSGDAEGIIIEAHMESGRGPVATALVEHGVLKKGHIIVAGGTYAKVRTLELAGGSDIEEASASTPVTITGFKSLPRFGDLFKAVASERKARTESQKTAQERGASERATEMSSSDLIAMINKNREQKVLNVIIRADVQGSLKSVIDSLRSLEHNEVVPRVVGQGVGAVRENDVRLAASSGATIYGFNVEVPANVRQIAAQEQVALKMYKVIYELIDDVKESLSTMLEDEVVETEVGRLIVRGIFRTTKNTIICGGEVTKGKIVPNAIARVTRNGEELAEVVVEKVQRQQQEVKEVFEGEMCGLQLATTTKLLLEEGDRLDLITRTSVSRSL